MTSPSLIDRFTSSRNRSPFLPLHNASARPPSEYDLDELEPRPDEPFVDRSPPGPRPRKPTPATNSPSSVPEFRGSRTSSSASPSRTKPKGMYAGPPPPISSSRLISGHDLSRTLSLNQVESLRGQGLLSASRLNLDSTYFDQSNHVASSRQDSVWRGLRRREKALEREVQQLLDLQASGLVAGSMNAASENGTETGSDADGSSMVNTFYSTATSKSRMVNSLHMPIRSTPEGNVIPIRQPAPKKPGLRSARVGLHKSMAALSELKAEEDAHVDAALAQRKDALAYLDKMSARRESIAAELHALEDDTKEPLGQELRDMRSEHDSLTEEIHLMEEKLVAMRNHRRSLREKMETLKNQREAGLSGYRAAGRDVDMDVRALMHRPPIAPLDIEALSQGGHADSDTNLESPGGVEFLRLRPERRTVEMARIWWQGELSILEHRKAQILADRQALDEGATMWSEVTALVAEFESGLREMLKTGLGGVEGDKAISQQAAIRAQFTKMDSVVTELEKKLQISEDRHWNLLICAIGAELEAFLEARSLLSISLGASHDESQPVAEGSQSDGHVEDTEGLHQEGHDESDNEVPPDLLISHHIDHDLDEVESPQRSVVLRREDSENEVPQEFLAEHGEKVD
ncbi:Fc.00g053960.m01.CDS01 [Cosmosporella sp. VM-42]